MAGDRERVLGSEPESCRHGKWEVALPDEYPSYWRNSIKWSFSRFISLVWFVSLQGSTQFGSGLLGKHCLCSCSIYCNS